MTLQKQILQIPFVGGIDEKTQKQVLEPGEGWATIQNLQQIKRGSFQTRPGFVTQSKARQDATTRTTGQLLFGVGDQTCVYDGQRIDVKSEADAVQVNAGTRRNFSLTTLPVHTQSGSWPAMNVDKYDVAFAANHVILAHLTGTGTSYVPMLTVLDAVTGTTVLEKTITPGAAFTFFKLATIGSRVFAFYSDTVNVIRAIDLDLTTLNTSSAAWSAPTIVVNDWDNVDWDLSSLTDLGTTNTAIYLAYTNGGTNVKMLKITSLSVLPTINAVATGAGNILTLAIGGDQANVLWAVFSKTGTATLVCFGASPSTLAVTQTQVGLSGAFPGTYEPFRLGVCATSTATFCAVAHARDNNTATTPYMYWVESSFSGATITATPRKSASGWMAITRPFTFGGRTLVHAGRVDGPSSGANLQQVECVIDITSGSQPFAAANANMRLSGWLDKYGYTISTSHIRTSAMAVAKTASAVYIATYKLYNAIGHSVGVLKLTADEPVAPPAIAAAGACIPGASPSVFDGRWCSELGFVHAPDVFVEDSGVAGSLNGEYAYTAVYEYLDSSGNIWWGPPAIVRRVTVTSKKVTATVTGCCVSSIRNAPAGDIQVALYRTAAGPGVVVYRVGSASATTDVVTFTDNVADGTLISNHQLYRQLLTSGAAQPRQAPPAFQCMAVHGDRVWGANGSTVWFSGLRTVGEGIWFSDAFQIPIEGGGEITAMTSQDGRLYVFKRGGIFYIDGEGPPDNGGNGSEFSTPIELPVTVGCIETRSVIQTAIGVFFQSIRGIELLTRSQEVFWIGEPVRDTLDANPVVSSAVIDDRTSRVMLTCSATEGGAAKILVYDMNEKLWTVSTFDPLVIPSAVSGAFVGDAYAILDAGGVVHIESATESTDDGAYVDSEIITPWIKMQGLQGYQRVWRVSVLGEHLTDHDLTISVATDYEDSWGQTTTWTSDKLAAMPLEQVQVHLAKQKCSAVRVRMQMKAPTGDGAFAATGKGAALYGLAIEWGQKQGTAKLAATQRG